LDASEEISCELVVACGDCTEVLEYVEEPLDEVAFAIEREIASPRGFAICLGRNHRNDAAFGQGVDERISVIGFVAEQSVRIDVLNQRLSAGQIMRLPRGEYQLDGIAQGIDECMDFGGQSAARPADRLLAVFFRAPALC
jgi:hypothetical protein